MVEGDSIKNKSDSYNVEAGIQPNYNSSRNNSIDNRSILQPYSLGSGGKDPEYQFAAVNKGYETDISSAGGDKHDVEKGSAAVIEVTNGVAIHGGNGGGGNNGGGSGADGRRSTGIRAGFEQAIELCGYGKFHYILLAICGLVSTSEEMDVISMSFILPSAECDLDLNTSSKGWLNSIIFIGMMVGAYFWGSIADAVGRKKVLIVISFMNGFCIVASSFSQTYEWFMLFRFLNGAALGGSGPVIWSYFAEFQPKSKRGSMLSFMAAFWTFGNLFVAGLAWLIIPSSIGFKTDLITYNSWRIFLMVCALPSFVVAFLLFYLPESPKFLLTKGKQEKAMAIFRGIFVTNTRRPAEQYPVAELDIDEKLLAEIKENQAGVKGKYSKMMSSMAEHSKQLFTSPILKFTLVSIIINFTFHIGYYGLMMWFPELFNRFEEYSHDHPDEHAGVCTVTKYVVAQGETETGTCSAQIPQSVFQESLISLASALPANLIAILGMDLLGRKFFLIFGTMTAGVCSAAMNFVFNSTQNLIVTAIFSGAISAANAALDCLITEVFPTHLRATGVAISMVAARMGGIIGNIVIATLLDHYCPAPTYIVATLLIGGGLMCLMLPNTTRKELN
ncbi:synaptic vesicle glycoprotein 2B [Bactrocera neohumeralis]|uniref:synaptic vesicle glycoprotein 2B n=1 Tax=Bactrocera tryoni TaxID=59916 RepID=UPI001A980517|nr:synaptic vesicle glycoprotein 2B [Bactrocera tryoni]XP_039958680.1 synaptic vesicle glycoprotein 2B [Bactrocera tryoni]XP_039958681.1 synaptic vesicle glycoprotein 2B [Bactrocera tryoni]XP_039958682.1 synaptic vesicle glycoprotein 2B [Bactrocera tryoni]XP_050332632.1 synaptic vesicle glycoprotein 2B [Bactrocera neohumeralis]XP_050332633.1 synaptic vesicle glycoprotein 2B [Bactrocera neohumeralis]XP_050332634.1 synaptic vesicle glycoprotein 2B [Bactrocera neohumeralis]XP_050332635.1 synapt